MLGLLAGWWWVPLLLVLLAVVGFAIIRQRRSKADIAWTTLDPSLQWDTATDESLKQVYDYVVDFSTSAIEWYQRERRPKRQLGFFLRAGCDGPYSGGGTGPPRPRCRS
jgi:hypothetical protein